MRTLIRLFLKNVFRKNETRNTSLQARSQWQPSPQPFPLVDKPLHIHRIRCVKPGILLRTDFLSTFHARQKQAFSLM